MRGVDDWRRIRGSRTRPFQRAKVPADRPAPSAGTPSAVVKVVSWGKSQRAAFDTARYITERSEHERPTVLIDEMGLHHADVDDLIRSWDLLPDSDNLSPEARRSSPAERNAMDEADRLSRRQTVHIVVSFPKGLSIAQADIEAMGAEFIAPLADAGHRVAFAVHDHDGRTHLHVLAKVSNDLDGRQLRLGPAELHRMREHQADVARKYGIELDPRPRIERPRIREKVKDGREELRRPDSARRKPLLERQVPGWYTRHGADYETRRIGARLRHSPPPPIPVELPPLAPASERNIDRWAAGFRNPQAAAQRFKEMLAEKASTAFWYAKHRPEVFGPLMEPDTKLAILTGRNVRAGAAWREAARCDLSRGFDSRVDRFRLAAAEEARSVADDRAKSKRRGAELAAIDRAAGASRQAPRAPEIRGKGAEKSQAQAIKQRTAEFLRRIRGATGRDRDPNDRGRG